MIDVPSTPGAVSVRETAARTRAAERIARQRDTLRPLGLAVIVVVVAGAIGESPHPGLQGRPLGVTLALCTFAVALMIAIRGRFTARDEWFQAAVILAMGAAGVALVALQPHGATELAGGVAVWFAVLRLNRTAGIGVGGTIAVAVDVAAALTGASTEALLAASLLLVLLGLVAYFMKEGRTSQDRTEMLLAQLEDAREEQTRAAAIEERGRIASELHDVLAHSLSGAAIQLQAARKLAEHEHATPAISAAIERAGALVKDGLGNARQAVGALRGDDLPSIAGIEWLIASYRNDMELNVTLSIEGEARTLQTDAGLALYRGAQEALTNIARYAPGAATTVVLQYGPSRTRLCIEDTMPTAPAGTRASTGLQDVGGGHGLAGLRERLERAGGTMRAGPTGSGWRVELDVPS